MTKAPPPSLLPRRFYRRPTITVARQLLGKILWVKRGRRWLPLTIVETEAYLGVRDRACHAFNGRRTPRVETMYGEGGHAYVYFIYGMYHCLNVVTGSRKRPEAVLIRALAASGGDEPRRYAGPGKLCQQLGIDKRDNGVDLVTRRRLCITSAPRVPLSAVVRTTRVGVAGYGASAARAKLRFYLKDHPSVSRR